MTAADIVPLIPTLEPGKHERHETNGCRMPLLRFIPFSCLRGRQSRFWGRPCWLDAGRRGGKLGYGDSPLPVHPHHA